MVKKRTLLLIAALVWMIAGLNIVRIGFIEYIGYLKIMNFIFSAGVFIVFWVFVFKKLVNKHTKRIKNFDSEKQYFWRFFDLKSFLIMAFMITFGLSIRAFNLMPQVFIAVFYTGLGLALTLAGFKFSVSYIPFDI